MDNLSITDVDTSTEMFSFSAQGQTMTWKVSTVCTIPLLEAMMANRVGQSRNKEGLVCTDMKPKLLYACLSYADTGYGSPAVLLTKLSTLVAVEDLITMMDYLGIVHKVPLISTVEDLKGLELRLKNIKSETMEKVARRTYEPSGDVPDRYAARDAAAELCFSMARSCLDLTDQKIKAKVTTDVLFIVSHAKTFGPRMRTHVWNTFDELVGLTPKQRQNQFERWISMEALAFECNEHVKTDHESDDAKSETDGECSDGHIQLYYDDDSDY